MKAYNYFLRYELHHHHVKFDDDYKKVIFNDIIYLGERVRDMVYLKDYNKVVMILGKQSIISDIRG